MAQWGWIWMFVWIAVLLLMVWLVARGPAQPSAAEDALAILRARFARGEISQQEFEQARAALLADHKELLS